MKQKAGVVTQSTLSLCTILAFVRPKATEEHEWKIREILRKILELSKKNANYKRE